MKTELLHGGCETSDDMVGCCLLWALLFVSCLLWSALLSAVCWPLLLVVWYGVAVV